MNWLEKHVKGFFLINGILLIVSLILGVWATLQFGMPNSNPIRWTSSQWNMIDFLWGPILADIIISLLLAAFCFLKKYIIFPVIFIYSVYGLKIGIINMNEIIRYGFIYPIDNLSGIIIIIEFILALLGTILWIRKLKRKT